MTQSLPTRIAAQFAWAPIEAWASTTASAADYAARAVARNSTPLDMAEDLAEFARVATLRERPTWAHHVPEVRAWPIARLLDYSATEVTAKVPTLVLPPQAGHASSIVDYGRDQSQMMTLHDAGLDRLSPSTGYRRQQKPLIGPSKPMSLCWKRLSNCSGGG